jgi:hypothetical protein
MEYFNEDTYDWRLSNCCQFHNNALAKKYNFNTCTRTYALKEGGKEKVLTRALGNAKKLELAMNEYYAKQPKEKRSFRVSTNMFPVYTWPAITPWFKEIEEELSIAMKKAGDAAKKHQVRLSVHPGQYTVLASTSKDVVKKTADYGVVKPVKGVGTLVDKFEKTKVGIWFQQYVDNTLQYIADKYDIELAKKDAKFRKQYPLILARIEELEKKVK